MCGAEKLQDLAKHSGAGGAKNRAIRLASVRWTKYHSAVFFRKEGAAQLLYLLSSYCTRLNKMLANINFLANISYQCSQLIKKSFGYQTLIMFHVSGTNYSENIENCLCIFCLIIN